MTNQKEIIIKHLKDNISINWIEALELYHIGGGFGTRISDVRFLLAKYGIKLNAKKVENISNSGWHFKYWINSEDRKKLIEKYSEIIQSLNSKSVIQKQIIPKQLSIF